MTPDPYKYFRIEARELATEMGKTVLALEKEPPSPARIAHMLRLAHTLKGAARVVRQREIADHAHSLEDALAPYRDSGGPLPRTSIDLLLGLIDQIGGRVSSLDAAPAAVDDAAPARPPVNETVRPQRADMAELEELLDDLTEVQTSLAQLQSRLAGFERLDLLAESLSEEIAAGGRAPTGERRRPATAGSLADELLIACRGLGRALVGAAEQMDRQLSEARSGAERLRLVAASALFTPLERATRDVASAQGKQVAFQASGGDLRLDAHVLTAVQSALVQVARNAVAHGIESPAARTKAGKPPAGRVVLEVVRRGRRVLFTCHDDGRGVDFDAVQRIAESKGMVPPGVGRLGPDVLLDRLMAGGISTSGTVSEMSGRGVGLDVVRDAVQSLGGKVTVRSEAGRGTAVEIDVPLSVASLEALHLEAGGMSLAIPLENVCATVHIAAREVTESPRGDAIVYHGQVVPFVPLVRAFASGAAQRTKATRWSAVLIEGAAGRAAIGVERLLGTSCIVLRPLPELCPASPTIAGATVEADGTPRLVLDPDGLVAAALRAAREPPAATDTARRPILVIDDSLTTRMLEQSILESAGYEVEVAVSAEEGLERARRERFALFLVDVEMPGMDGFTFVERTQADAELRDVPAILVTSRSAPEDRKRGETVGARGYIVKGEFNQVELLDRIEALVR